MICTVPADDPPGQSTAPAAHLGLPCRGDDPGDLYDPAFLAGVGHVGFDGRPDPQQDDLDQYQADQIVHENQAEQGGAD